MGYIRRKCAKKETGPKKLHKKIQQCAYVNKNSTD